MIPVFCSNPLTAQPDLGSVSFSSSVEISETQSFLTHRVLCVSCAVVQRIDAIWMESISLHQNGLRTSTSEFRNLIFADQKSGKWRELQGEHKGFATSPRCKTHFFIDP